MKRALMVLLVCAPFVSVSAQTARRPVRAGDVKGLELQLEGAQTVVRGQSLRWLLTAYEVVGLDGLRPASGAEVKISTSLAPGEPLEQQTDENGRALVSLVVPEDAPASFGVSIEVRAGRGVLRRFDLPVQTREFRALELHAQPAAFERTRIQAFGRLYRVTDEVGLGAATVTLRARDGRGPLGPPREVTTDARGVFLFSMPIPAEVVGQVEIEARSEADEDEREVRAIATTQISEIDRSPLRVQISPREHVVSPRVMAEFDVVVRRADGRPVPDAVVHFSPGGPPVMRIADVPPADRDDFTVTDARGHAVARIEMPNVGDGFTDVQVAVQAGREGIGAAIARTTVRVAADRYATALTIEGAALSADLGGRVYVRVATMDGAPAAEVPVTIEGPRVARAEGRTEAGGVAVFDLDLSDAADPRCGGAAAASVTVRAGSVARPFCLPIDPDAAVRPRVAPTVGPGAELQVSVARRADVRRAPVVVTLLQSHGGSASVIAHGELAPGEDTISIAIPEGTRGAILVRARPLIGASRQEARGAMTATFVAAGGRFEMAVRPRGNATSLTTEVILPQGERSLVAVALPAEEARTLHQQFLADEPLGHAPTDAALAAQLATLASPDIGAASVLREGRLERAPAPTAPVQLGLLRDPWRARARFVEGRLGLLFHAIEARVDAAVPEQMEEVAVEIREGRYALNRQLLASLGSEALGAEGATGLGGEPLTIEEIERLDRAFDYDAVAKRITRERLFALILGLRAFVTERGFDLPWARPGDPTLWLEHLKHRAVEGTGVLQGRHLVDGWGRPFELRAVSRPRFTRLQPVGGFELVSAGPDGRFGNGDDVYDPTARVLPSGSLYAEAVGEDALVARLQGVELGRATVSVASGYFGRTTGSFPIPEEGQGGLAELGQLPPRLVRDDFALALERPTVASSASGALVAASGATQVPLAIDSEPRTWGVFAWAVDGTGRTAVGLGSARGGADVLATAALPRRLRVGEPLSVAVHLTNVTEDAKAYAVASEGEGLTVDVPASVQVPPGETRSLVATFSGQQPGEAIIRLKVAPPTGDPRMLRERVHVDRGRHPIRRVATGYGPLRTTLDVPGDAAGAHTRVVVLTPTTVGDDPDLADVRQSDPALIAWSHALSGRPVDDALRADLLRSQTGDGAFEGGVSPISTAAAIVALSSLFEDGRPDADAQAARTRALGRLDGLGPVPDVTPFAGMIRTRSAVVAALATSGLGSLSAPRPTPYPIDDGFTLRRRPPSDPDPLSGWLTSLRTTLRDAPEEPTLLARAAAALLLADPRDGHGRAMFTRAMDSVRETDEGLRVTSSERRPGNLEELSATLALSIAAHQLGRDEEARALIRAASRHASALTRAGGEPTFWWLAAAAYGAMGTSPSSTSVDIDGTSRALDLSTGRAELDLSIAPGDSVRVAMEDQAVFVRVESVFSRPFSPRVGLFELALRGQPGRSGGAAAYELVVTARAAVGAPIVDLQLPAGVEADERLLAALEAAGPVARAEARNPGFVRLRLTSLADGVSVPIALPFRWESPSQVRGLAAVAYPAGDPSAMSILAPSVLTPND